MSTEYLHQCHVFQTSNNTGQSSEFGGCLDNDTRIALLELSTTSFTYVYHVTYHQNASRTPIIALASLLEEQPSSHLSTPSIFFII